MKRKISDDSDEQELSLTEAQLPQASSSDDTTMIYKPGSIKRVYLKNFLTYSEVEFRPGPRLNIVIGPNGTGKSTILCAICLGLGGQPPLLGRADDARTFIRNSQDIAEIEIEIEPWPNSATHVLRRVIDRNKGAEGGKGVGSNTYFINGKVVNVKAIQKLVQETYHISIENLCTFLPQDRVGSFSALDFKMLLHETEKSLSGSQNLYHDHLALIELEESLLNKSSDLTSMKDKLSALESEHSRLEVEKKKLEERENYQRELKLLEQKHVWLLFDQAREKTNALKDQRKAMKDKTRDAEISLQPIKEHVETMKYEVERSKAKSREFEKNIQSSWKNFDTGIRKAEMVVDEMESVQNNLNSIDARKTKEERDFRTHQARLQQTEALLLDYPPLEELETAVRIAKDEAADARKHVNDLKRIAEAQQAVFREKKDEKERLVRRLEQMQDDKARRNERIFRSDPKLLETYNFVQHTKRDLRHPVWGPIVCEVVMKDTNSAAYLEQHVPNSVLKTFVVESKEDYNLLYREAREKRNLFINIIVIEGGSLKEKQRIYSPSRFEILKKDHGVLCYLDETFEAPEAVMQALIESAQVDQVLIGSSKTQESLDRRGLLEYLSEREDGRPGKRSSVIFSSHMNKSYKYTNSISRYSGKPSLRVDDVNPAKMLSPGVPPEQKALVEQELDRATREVDELEPALVDATSAVDRAVREGQDASNRVKDATKAVSEVNDIKGKIEQLRRRVREAENDLLKDDTSEKKRYVKEMKSHINTYMSSLETSLLHYDEWIKISCTLAALKISEENIMDRSSKYQDILAEKQDEFNKLLREYQVLSEQYEQNKNTARELMEKAKDAASLKDADGNELPLKAELDKLPSDLEEIEEAIEHTRQKVRSVHDNPEVLRRYEEQKREIENMKRSLENMNQSNDIKRKEIQNLRLPWEASLNSAMKEVNELFSQYMKELGCAGEVKICHGCKDGGENRNSRIRNRDDEADGNFKDWGIEIRVKFRDKSDLQALSAHVHSGGERSVSTIMYLMALQDKMVSPFRCVDEINQGLDERNERLVFRRIVENATKSPRNHSNKCNHSGQYFLITPKLLPNLTDMENENVTILCIFNGSYNFENFTDWNIDSFVLSRMKNETTDDDAQNSSAPLRKSRKSILN